VWAANDAIYEYNRLRGVSLDELANPTRDVEVGSRVGMLTKPALQRIRLRAFSRDDSHGNLRRVLIIWAVERHRRYWITAKPATRLLLQWPKRLVEQVLSPRCSSV
jgi:hypothetical protein